MKATNHLLLTAYCLLITVYCLLFAASCSSDDTAPDLTVMRSELSFNRFENSTALLVKSATDWKASASEAWITLNPTAGGAGTSKVEINIAANDGLTRQGLITYTSGNLTRTTAITQYNYENEPADNDEMPSNAVQLAAKMGLGWNLGNSLEATDGTVASETMWGNARTTKQLIDGVKAAGFNSIRIPCAWNAYLEDQVNYRIKDEWLARVKEVVNYCTANEMYVIINTHWDGGWLEENPYYEKQDEINRKLAAIWKQIAVYFIEYNELLLFAGTNEVHTDWGSPSEENISVQQSFNQTFVDAVRSTGGRNTWRNLIIQSYSTNIDYAVQYPTMPDDETPNRLMMEVHYYDPYDFTIASEDTKFLWGKEFAGRNEVSSFGQEDWADEKFGLMRTHFINKGIPVILGEYGATLRTRLSGTQYAEHVKARNAYLQYVTQSARNAGCVPFYWDNGVAANGSGLFNRATGEQLYPDAINAIVSP